MGGIRSGQRTAKGTPRSLVNHHDADVLRDVDVDIDVYDHDATIGNDA